MRAKIYRMMIFGYGIQDTHYFDNKVGLFGSWREAARMLISFIICDKRDKNIFDAKCDELRLDKRKCDTMSFALRLNIQ